MKLPTRGPIAYVAGAAVLVALLVIARPVLNPPATPVRQSSNQTVATAGQAPAVPVVDLNLDRLRTVGGQLRESERDPFRFRPKPPPPAPRVQAPPPAFQPAVPQGPPPPPPIPLKFFGVMTVNGQRIAAFVDERGNTFTGKEGDVLEGRYRLLRINGQDSVDLAFLDGRGRQSIRMTGQ
jgi:hypothetical protein